MLRRDWIRWLADLPGRRGAWLLLALSGVALEACALYFQYGLSLDPCVMCIYIRVAVLGIIAAGLVGATAPRMIGIRVLALAGWAVAATAGVRLSRELVEIQTPGSFAACSFLPRFPEWLPLHEWLPEFFLPTGRCTDEVWSWLGLSMAQWTQWVFVGYLAVFAIVLLAWLAAGSARRQTAIR